MAGFFETVVSRIADGDLLAAWITGGDAAGARALFSTEGGRRRELFRDADFPVPQAEAILRTEPGTAVTGENVFTEPLSRGRRLVVCGGGHVASAWSGSA